MKELLIQNIEDFKLITIFFVIFLCLFLIYILKREWFEKIYKHRFLVGFFIFIMCVVFEISGSSIGMWNKYLNNVNSDDRSISWRI